MGVCECSEGLTNIRLWGISLCRIELRCRAWRWR